MPASSLLSSSPLVLLVAALATGCVISLPVGDGDEEAGSSSSDGSDSDGDAPPAGSSTSIGGTGPVSDGSPDPSSTTAVQTSGDTGDDPPPLFDLPGFDECDIWDQDCPKGWKCMPFANDGADAWNDTRCTPIAEDPDAVGEICTEEGGAGLSGVDSCELGAMCWAIDPDTAEGTCVALCQGNEAAPLCPETTACAIGNEGVVIVCLPLCDPMLQDCAEGLTCYPSGDQFLCMPDASVADGTVGDSCEDIAVCDPGLLCAQGPLVPGCESNACCTPFCDVDDPMPPCLPGQSCVPYYEPGMAPEGYEHVGLCALPS